MPKSKIIRDVVNDKVPIEQSLSRLMVLAHDVNNEKIAKWAEQELNGYNNKAELPEYRRVRCNNFRYSGINGNFQVTRIPLPTSFVRKDILEVITDVGILDGIKAVSNYAKSKDVLTKDYTTLAGEIHDVTQGEVTCTSIEQIIVPAVFESICTNVKNILIKSLCELESEYGILDDLDIDEGDSPSNKSAKNSELDNAVFNVNASSLRIENKDPWYSKIGWNLIVPIITGIIGAVVATIIIKYFGI